MICSAFYSPHIGSYALNFSSVARCAKELDTPTANFLLLEIGIAVNLLPCHYTLSHLKPEDMQRQNKFTSPNLPKCIIPPTLHSHFIHLSPTSYHVSNWQRQYIQHSSLSLSLSFYLYASLRNTLSSPHVSCFRSYSSYTDLQCCNQWFACTSKRTNFSFVCYDI